MSFKAVCEFAVHLEGFRNIDLYHQGLYHIRIVIYHEQDGEVIFPSPESQFITEFMRFLRPAIREYSLIPTTWKREKNKQAQRRKSPKIWFHLMFWMNSTHFALVPSLSDSAKKKSSWMTLVISEPSLTRIRTIQPKLSSWRRSWCTLTHSTPWNRKYSFAFRLSLWWYLQSFTERGSRSDFPLCRDVQSENR